MKKRLFTLLSALLVVFGCVACDVFQNTPKDPDNDKDNNGEITETLISHGDTPFKLWYDEEAPKIKEGNHRGFMTSWGNQSINDDGWTNWSLPLGNGYFGVNAFGRTETERLQITDKTLANPWQEAGGDYSENGGLNNFSETYIDFGHTNVSNYSRYLDIDNAISGVNYTYNGVNYSREYFTSYPDKALVIYLDSDTAGKLDFTLRPTVPFEKEYSEHPGDGYSKTGQVESYVDSHGTGCVELSGYMNYYGIDFLALYRVYTEGGTVNASTVSTVPSENQNGGSHSKIGDGTIEVKGATKAYIVVTLGTDYELDGAFAGGQFEREKKATQFTTIEDTKEKVEGYLASIEDLILGESVQDGYKILKDRHIEDYKNLFDRVDFTLDVEDADIKLTTDELLKKYKAGSYTGKFSKYLEMLIFQYGRYLIIASSRPGTLPAHLQGTWNCYDIPPWSSGYWHNINIQMNYWHVFTTNLSETFDAYIDYNKAYVEDLGAGYADALVQQFNPSMYGKDGGNGWTVGVSGNPYFSNSDRSPGNMGFMTQLFWDYYRYTKDEDVLKKIYPVLANAARYITKSVKQDENGKYLVEHCDSPEQYVNGVWYYTTGATYAQTLSYLNNYYTLLAAKEMGIDINDTDVLNTEEHSILKTIMDQLELYDPINIGLSGQVKEFREEEYYGDLVDDPYHRHVSQLVGLYPGNLINSSTPAWLDGAKVALDGRAGLLEGGDGVGFKDNYGWVYSHKMSLYSRLDDSMNAYDQYKKLISNTLGQNLWTKYAEIYQAESNFGATAGVAEMLLQSHNGYIEPLAALPAIWQNGSYVGLVAEGNFEVSAAWKDGLATQFDIKSNKGGTVRISYPSITQAKVVDIYGNDIKYKVLENDIIEFDTKEGEIFVITGFKKVNKLSKPTNFTFNRVDLGEFNFTWNSVSNAKSYNLYKAVGNDSKYTYIDTVTSTNYTYTPSLAESNERTTFVVTAVDKDGKESDRALCYYNPIETSAIVNDFRWCVTTDGNFEVTISSNGNAIEYRLLEKAQGASDFVLVTKSTTSNVLTGGKYNKTSEYAIETVSRIDNAVTRYVIDKNYNILEGKKFIPTTESNKYIYNSAFGYSCLTDGAFSESNGRFSSVVNNSNTFVEATVSLGQKYVVNEFRIYDYKNNHEYIGKNLRIEAYLGSTITKTINISASSDIAAHRSNSAGTNGYGYLTFDLGGVEADSIKLYIGSPILESITFYEVEVMGYTEIATAPSLANIFSGKRFTPTTEAAANTHFTWLEGQSFGYDSLTDGSFDETYGRFSTRSAAEGSTLFNGTIDLGANYVLNELRLYDYNQDASNAGNDLKVEVYTNGSWVTVVDFKSNSEIAAKRVSLGAGGGNGWIQINMEGVNASMVRISSTGASTSNYISFYEIECFGKAA